jgi:hypothetical protein
MRHTVQVVCTSPLTVPFLEVQAVLFQLMQYKAVGLNRALRNCYLPRLAEVRGPKAHNF